MIDFKGQVAIVTGAGRGMGRAIALLLAERGAKVVVNDYGGDPTGVPGTSEPADSVVEEIRARGGEAIVDATTVGTGGSADAIVAAALDAFGRIDILVNNAGGSTIAPLDELADEEIERVMRTNYWGAYLLMRRVWPHMRRQRYGRILNMASSATLGIGTVAPYSSAKAAMVGLTCEAAIEGKPVGIQVNAVFPAGYTRLAAKSQEDARVWMETWFAPDLVAQAIAYFVSREMLYTGEIYGAGGGRVSRIATFNNDGYFDRNLTPESLAAHI
jgi:NAD(P)-dependent dehydrogenase (short-subunit alcohol dehydrogenase family)